MLAVTVDPAVPALNNATFGKSWRKTITTRDVQPSVGFAKSRGRKLLPGKNRGKDCRSWRLTSNFHVDANFFRVKPGIAGVILSASGSTGEPSLTGVRESSSAEMADLVYTGRFDLLTGAQYARNCCRY